MGWEYSRRFGILGNRGLSPLRAMVLGDFGRNVLQYSSIWDAF